MEVTYYRGSKEMKATIDLTIDKSALTQQNNRQSIKKETTCCLNNRSFLYSPTANAEQLLHQKAILRFLFSGAFGKRNSFAEQIIPKLSST